MGVSEIFTHIDRPPIDFLPVREDENGRQYQLPSGIWVPSVTTIIGKESKKGIEEWKKRIGEEKAERIRDSSATRGTLFHELIEEYLCNRDIDFKKVNPFVKQFFFSCKPTLDKINKIWYIEAQLYSEELGTAGRVDCIGEFKGKLSIIDFKNSRDLKKKSHIENYRIQTAVYSKMFEEMTGVAIRNRVIIIQSDLPKAQVFIEDGKLDKYIDIFNERKNL